MSKRSESELNDIKEKLDEIQNDMKAFIEDSNREHLETILAFVRNDYSNALEKHLSNDIKEGLAKNMVEKCERLEVCRPYFTGMLQKNAALIKQDSVDSETIDSNRAEIKHMREILPYKKCDICLAETGDLFEKQVNLMKSMRIYEVNKDKKQYISQLPTEDVVDDMLESLCHAKRFEILKAISGQTMSFSALSKLTDLRGGNLLFHLQKLTDSGMILQQHERGDYMITSKGFKVMEGIGDIYSSLAPGEN
ncbi:MAG: hypothetical protein AWU58_1388 [Methanohalophilus sp. T328-1]|jgi:predicted transcriptional regulator|uniref:ArsR family transcriptional regulator n=1 Tax=Methanohalophilus euhalobius TaxID=51203 RepID=A0A285GAH2_9EURY|nr:MULTISPECIES: helix-turn-helix domain-containing protein [Methanohalophilus]KXS42946.1 MAG: hypothetical protein AWU58_1388 [Methanohalophilus sp. T328-1]RSD33896.1 MAG: hypothetical protein CI953_1253 [Methanohalophilus sp.]OBZ34326.1 MAG: hypothetical protein A9957_03720 [Methanohalophilus sp. DAL1]ODV48870.1 MAG: hypothetical protein A8273_1882 [Methanohalophilus sp. 2-GBenrich]RSD35116.1 MAG: hypothetical protein CI952_1091 [Methanohalophilus sp.]